MWQCCKYSVQMPGLFGGLLWRFRVQQFAFCIWKKRRTTVITIIQRKFMVMKHDVGNAAFAQDGFDLAKTVGMLIFTIQQRPDHAMHHIRVPFQHKADAVLFQPAAVARCDGGRNLARFDIECELQECRCGMNGVSP